MATKHKPRPAALPPIPSDTIEGARLQGIADAIHALSKPTPWNQYGLELQPEECAVYAKRLGVPAAFFEVVYRETMTGSLSMQAVMDLAAWCGRLGRKVA